MAALGVTDYEGKVDKIEVKSTAENFQSAIDGETYVFTTMYPEFIKDAETEKSKEAIVSLNYVQDAEKGHAKIYADALANLSTPNALATVYYLCPKCGNVFANTPVEVCELCQTSADSFIVFKATISAGIATDGTSEATQAVK